MLPEFSAVIVAQYVEFAHRIDAEKLAASAAGRHVVFSGAGELDTVEKKKILLWAVAVDGEIVGSRGVRNTRAACFLRGEIHDAGIQGKKQIIATAIEGEILDGLRTDEAWNV